MSVVWEITSGSETRTLAAWGIRGAVLTRRSFGVDELVLQAPGLGFASDPLFAAQSTIVLKRAGVRFFTGRITSPEAYGGASQEGHTYIASGPWWFLENLRYQEVRKMAIDPTDPDSDLQDVFSPRAVLFNTVDGDPQTNGAQITQALSFANSRGAGITVGTIGLGALPPWEEASSVSCAEVIKRSSRYAPDASQWLDYSTAAPSFNVRRRSVLDAVTLDLADANRIELIDPIRPLYEQRPPGVRFFFEDIVTRSNGRTWARYTSQSAGNPDLVGGINEVIELGGQGGDNPEPIPGGLAAAYYAAVSTLNYGGTIRLAGRDVLGDIVPGKVLNLANGRAEWEDMRASVQAWRGDLIRGREEITIGQPAFLGAGAFVEHLRYARLRNKSGYLDSRRTGEGLTSAVTPSSILYNGATHGFTEISLCDPAGGDPRVIKVFSEIVSVGGGP
jgi:hypothetical protein